MKILLVDDSRATRAMVGKGLRNYQCEVFEGANGLECLEIAARELPAVIVLDVTMPMLDGVETLKRLKADPALAAIPVVMLTANCNTDEVERVLKLGAAAYVGKVQKPTAVVEKIAELISLRPLAELAVQA